MARYKFATMRDDEPYNVIDQPLYDSFRMPAAATSTVSFFQIPKGQPGTAFAAAGNKTLADTNLTNAGLLPSPQRFLIQAIAFVTGISVTLADMRLLLNGAVFELTIGTKPFLQCPLNFIPGGAGVLNSGSAAAATEVLNHGFPAPQAIKVLTEPIPIDKMENFGATVSWPVAAITLAVATPVQLFLHGTLYRSIQ